VGPVRDPASVMGALEAEISEFLVEPCAVLLEGHQVDVVMVAGPASDMEGDRDTPSEPDRTFQASQHAQPRQHFTLVIQSASAHDHRTFDADRIPLCCQVCDRVGLAARLGRSWWRWAWCGARASATREVVVVPECRCGASSLVQFALGTH